MAYPQSITDTPAEEKCWIALARNGNDTAFSQLVELYQPHIQRLCYQKLGDSAEAEDAAQEVFIRAYLKLDLFDDQRKFSSWLFAIAAHYCIDQLKKRQLTTLSWDDIPVRYARYAQSPSADTQLMETETAEEIQQMLQMLPPNHRRVIVMKYWHAMPIAEIAETLDTTVSTIKGQLFRARRKMESIYD